MHAPKSPDVPDAQHPLITPTTPLPPATSPRSACMHQKHLLRFIKSKLKKEPDEVVIFRWVCNAPVLLALI